MNKDNVGIEFLKEVKKVYDNTPYLLKFDSIDNAFVFYKTFFKFINDISSNSDQSNTYKIIASAYRIFPIKDKNIEKTFGQACAICYNRNKIKAFEQRLDNFLNCRSRKDIYTSKDFFAIIEILKKENISFNYLGLFNSIYYWGETSKNKIVKKYYLSLGDKND